MMQTLNEYLNKNYVKCESREDVPFSIPEEYQDISSIMYRVGKENKIFAFIGYPKTPMPEGGYPAVVLIHGGGGYAFYEWVTEWTEKGYVAIAPDFYGQQPEDNIDFSNRRFYAGTDEKRKGVNPLGGPSGWGSFEQLHSENPWIYFCVMNAIAAVDLLCADRRVNSNQICAAGISWGGVILLIVSSVEKRIKAASITYSSAFISDTQWGIDSGIGMLSVEEKELYDRFYDPQTYLDDISCPMYFAGGTNDIAFSFYNRKRTYERVKGPVYLGCRHYFAHDHENGWNGDENARFFDCILNGKKFPTVKTVKLHGKRKVICDFRPQKITCVFTTEDAKSLDMCEWAELEIKDLEDFMLPESAVAFFIEAVTAEGLRVSSDLYFK